MATKHAGLGAALAVLLAVFGLITLVGVILLMMLFQPDIEHSPSQIGSTNEFRVNQGVPLPDVPNLENLHRSTGALT